MSYVVYVVYNSLEKKKEHPSNPSCRVCRVEEKKNVSSDSRSGRESSLILIHINLHVHPSVSPERITVVAELVILDALPNAPLNPDARAAAVPTAPSKSAEH
jgi:hypothetical protein